MLIFSFLEMLFLANDKHSAFGFFTVVKQFDQAIAMVEKGTVLECNEDDLPPFPPPYRPISVRDVCILKLLSKTTITLEIVIYFSCLLCHLGIFRLKYPPPQRR